MAPELRPGDQVRPLPRIADRVLFTGSEHGVVIRCNPHYGYCVVQFDPPLTLGEDTSMVVRTYTFLNEHLERVEATPC